MSGAHVISLRDLPAAIAKDMKNVAKAAKRGLRKAARSGRGTVKRNVPVAFGELRESVHAADAEEGARIIADAPHAAAVENGSRPHWVPLEPLIAWVRLRGFQGLRTSRQQSRLPGTTTAGHASHVAAQLASLEHRGPAAYSDADAPMQIAKAIQLAIAKRGTKPHAYMAKSLPAIEADVAHFVAEELAKV